MTTHTFTLIVEGPELQSQRLIDSVFEAGCDDALIGRSDGIQYADFDRDADTFEDAILGVIAEPRSIEGVRVARLADAGLVSMANIATRTGRTRESVRLLITGEQGPGGFPPPVTDPRSRYRLWRTNEVDHWFRRDLGHESGDTHTDRLGAAINAGLDLHLAGRDTRWNTPAASPAPRVNIELASPCMSQPRIDQVNIVIRRVDAAAAFLIGLGIDVPGEAGSWDSIHRNVPAHAQPPSTNDLGEPAFGIDLDSPAFAHH